MSKSFVELGFDTGAMLRYPGALAAAAAAASANEVADSASAGFFACTYAQQAIARASLANEQAS